jgi:hypothetical protein
MHVEDGAHILSQVAQLQGGCQLPVSCQLPDGQSHLRWEAMTQCWSWRTTTRKLYDIQNGRGLGDTLIHPSRLKKTCSSRPPCQLLYIFTRHKTCKCPVLPLNRCRALLFRHTTTVSLRSSYGGKTSEYRVNCIKPSILFLMSTAPLCLMRDSSCSYIGPRSPNIASIRQQKQIANKLTSRQGKILN